MLDIAIVPCDGADRKCNAALAYIRDTAEAWYSDVEISTAPPHGVRVRYSARASAAAGSDVVVT